MIHSALVSLDYSGIALEECKADVAAGTFPAREHRYTIPTAELQRLRREVKRLEMEKQILKKAAAFFARENE